MEFGDVERPEEGKNKMFLVCDYCKCKVMRPGYGKLVEKEVGSLTRLAQFSPAYYAIP